MLLNLQIVEQGDVPEWIASCTSELSLLARIWKFQMEIPDRHYTGEFLITFEGLSEYETAQVLNVLHSYCEVRRINCQLAE